MADPATPSGSTRLAALIGTPVRHSLSPVIHNAAYAAMGVDWTYVALEVGPGNGPAAIAAMRTLGIGGLSVTMPHKAAIVDAVDRCTDIVTALGAANTVFRSGDELVADNTDGVGLVNSLRASSGIDLTGMHAVVFGAGGAARSTCVALAEAGCGRVSVVNRTADRAAGAAALAGDVGQVAEPAAVASADLVVNATLVGMAGTAGADAMPFDPELLHAGQVVVDLVYHPVQTLLLRAALESGAIAVDGVGMLVHQAARQIELWTSRSAPIEVMTAAATAALDARG